MRADRLLQIVMLLQARGRMTASELANQLEVSVRTVQRDMDALSGAGVPVFARRGAEGGWELTDGFRTTLTGLTPSEALAVVVGRPEGVLAELGLDDPGDRALLKVMASTPALAQHAAEHARQRVHVDLTPWTGRRADSSVLPALHRATAEDLIVRIRYGASSSPFAIAPLGLVCKGIVWYLVARRGDVYRTYRVSRVRDVEVTDEHFDRPAGFDLPSHWRDVGAQVRETFPTFNADLRVRGAAIPRLRWATGAIASAPPDKNGWVRVRADLETEEEAVSVILSLAPDVVVDAPRSLRTRVIAAADEFTRLARRHRSTNL